MWACLLGGWLGFGVYAGCVRCGCLRFLVLACLLGGWWGRCGLAAPPFRLLGAHVPRAGGFGVRAAGWAARRGVRCPFCCVAWGRGVNIRAHTEREGGAGFRPGNYWPGRGRGWRARFGAYNPLSRQQRHPSGLCGSGRWRWLPGSGCGRAVTVRGSKIDTTGAGAIVRSWPWWQFHGECAWVVLGACRFPLGGGVAWW